MIKRFLMVLSLGLILLGLAGCKDDTTYTLPDLTGLNKQQVEAEFASMAVFLTLEDKVDNTATRGRFLGYGNDLNVGDQVEKNSNVIVYFAVHKNILPDLTGVKNEDILDYFKYMDLIVEVKEFETSLVDPGYFTHYGNNLKAGDELVSNSSLVIFVAKEPLVILKEIFISKYLEGTSNNQALELYNPTDKSVDLSNYQVFIYTDGALEPSIKIQLEGSLNSKETYMITHGFSDSSLKDKADLITDDLVFDGNDMISISFQDIEVIDILGQIGWGFYTFNDVTLVRHEFITEVSVTYNMNDWGYYKKDYFEVFKTHPVSYPETFTYNDTDLLLDYFSEPKGMVQVTYSHVYDGDTAYFSPYFLGDDRIRFVGIDTPEMGSGTVATAARNYASLKLGSASEIYIQHDPVSGIYDTYQRYLGLVWYDGHLLNYEMVLKGYSQNNYSDTQDRLIFNNIPLSVWMRNAETYAKENKLGVWG